MGRGCPDFKHLLQDPTEKLYLNKTLKVVFCREYHMPGTVITFLLFFYLSYLVNKLC